MTFPPRAGMCQGNFAATVKEILPIYENGLCDRTIRAIPRIMPRISGNSPLTGDLYVAKLDLHNPDARRSSCPDPWTPKASRSVSKAS